MAPDNYLHFLPAGWLLQDLMIRTEGGWTGRNRSRNLIETSRFIRRSHPRDGYYVVRTSNIWVPISEVKRAHQGAAPGGRGREGTNDPNIVTRQEEKGLEVVRL